MTLSYCRGKCEVFYIPLYDMRTPRSFLRRVVIALVCDLMKTLVYRSLRLRFVWPLAARHEILRVLEGCEKKGQPIM
jgi:hypothetical protein